MTQTTYALITSFIPDVYEAALDYARDMFIMPQIVDVHTDMTGWNNRQFTEYTKGTLQTGLAETDDISGSAFNRGSLATLTPTEAGHRYDITDRRIETDDVMSIMADAARDLSYITFEKVESDLASNFANFTAGTIGTAGGTLTWENIFQAKAILAATAIPAPYICVLHEYQYMHMANQANLAGLSNAAPLSVRDQIHANYYVGNFSNISFYVVGNAALAAGTAVKAGLYNRQAISYDLRRGFRIETERDASARHTEMVATIGYAHGTKRTAWGVTLLGTASAPS